MGLESLGIVSMKDETIIKEMLGLNEGTNKTGTNKLIAVKSQMATSLQKVDMIQFLERYKWTNLPKGLTQDLIERILYFRGRGVFFKLLEEYFFLPFGLDGEIDTYGRYKSVKPLSFNGTAQIGRDFLPDYTIPVIRDPQTLEEGEAVILYDTSIMLSQYNLPPFYQQMFIISEQADTLVLIKKNMVNSTVLYTFFVENENQKQFIETQMMNWADENLFKYITVITKKGLKVDELKSPTKLETQTLFEAWTSYDNLRKTLIGLRNNGLFQKTAHSLEGEVESQEEQSDAIYKNGLRMRQDFVDVVNKKFGLNISVEENVDEQAAMDDNLKDAESLDKRDNHHKEGE